MVPCLRLCCRGCVWAAEVKTALEAAIPGPLLEVVVDKATPAGAVVWTVTFHAPNGAPPAMLVNDSK